MGVGEAEAIMLQDGPHELSVALKQLVKHLCVVDVVPSTRTVRWGGRRQQLCLRDCLDVHLLVERVHWGCPEVVSQVIHALVEVLVALVKEVLLSATLSVVS